MSDYNKLPENLRPVERNTFWHYFLIFGGQRDQRQVWPENYQDKFKELGIEHRGVATFTTIDVGFNGKKFALLQRVENAVVVEPLFFEYGCEHQFTNETIGKCYHRVTCQKCGYSYEYDSGD